jgi:ribosomal protein L7Ae-like RNA K-turn-binding protein
LLDGLDDRVESIIESAEQHNCPCIFGLNKKRLGNAIGKDIKISVVGIYNHDGADYKGICRFLL